MTSLEIARIPIALEGEWGEAKELLEQFSRYGVARPDGPVTRVRLLPEVEEPPADAPVLLSRANSWVAVKLDEGLILIGGSGSIASVERLFMHGFAAVLATTGSLLFHAAAVEGPEGAIAFLGPSEAGKTTAAQNCPARLLHPDRVAIGVNESGAWLAPVPFLYGEPRVGSVRPVRLGGFALVHQSEVNSLDPVAEPLRPRVLCASVLLPPDPVLASGVLETVAKLSREVPMHVLHARRTGGFWHLLAPGARPTVARIQESD